MSKMLKASKIVEHRRGGVGSNRRTYYALASVVRVGQYANDL